MTPNRAIFWQIEHICIFYALAALSTILFLVGVGFHIMVWKRSARGANVTFTPDAFKTMLLDTFLGRRLIEGDMAAGFMHLLIFWGFVILFLGTVVLSIHHYVAPFLEGRSNLIFSFAMEIAGLMLFTGVLWALIRRYLQRVPRLERRSSI